MKSNSKFVIFIIVVGIYLATSNGYKLLNRSADVLIVLGLILGLAQMIFGIFLLHTIRKETS